jgi:hypothetical protein
MVGPAFRLPLALLSAALVAACVGSAPRSPTTTAVLPPLSIDNGTSIPVTLVINGNVIETVAPGARQDPISAPLPPLPWSIEARTPTGRVLSTLTVGDSDHVTSASGRAVRKDLSCGQLDVWSGPPLLGGPFIPGPSGDCQ